MEESGRLSDVIVRQFREWRTARANKEKQWLEVDALLNERSQVKNTQKDDITKSSAEMMNGPDGKNKVSGVYSVGMANVYKDVETFVAMYMSLWFQNGYNFFTLSLLNMNDEALASIVKEYIIYVYEQIDLKKHVEPIIRQIARYGTGVCSIEWLRSIGTSYHKMQSVDPITGEFLGFSYQKGTETIYDNLYIRPLDIFNVVWDPANLDLDNSKVIIKKYLTIDEYLSDPYYPTYTREELELMTVQINLDDTSTNTQARSHYEDSLDSQGFWGEKKLLVYEAWGDFYVQKELCRNYKVQVLCNTPGLNNTNSNRLICFEPNPYRINRRPILICPLSVSPNRVYGDSPLDHVIGIYSVANTLINQVLDASNMHNNRPTLLNSRLAGSLMRNGQKDELDMGYTSIIPVNGIPSEVMQRLQDPSFSNTQQTTTALYQQLIQEASGALGFNEMMTGGAINPYVKANYAAGVQQGSMNRISLNAQTIERVLIEPLLKITVDMMREFTSQSIEMMDKQNKQPIMFNPAMLTHRFSYSIQGPSSTLNRQQTFQQMSEIFQQLGANPITAPLFNWAKVSKDLLALAGIREAENYFVPQAFQMANVPGFVPQFFERVKELFTFGSNVGTMKAQAMGQAQGGQPPMAPPGGNTGGNQVGTQEVYSEPPGNQFGLS
jgi:hypothetical protein